MGTVGSAQDSRVAERSAIVVGGGSGLGFASAVRLLGRGLDVGISGRDTTRLDSARDRLLASFPDRRVEIAAGDAGVEREASAAMTALMGVLGTPMAFVNCAGTFTPVEYLQLDADTWTQTTRSTLDSCVYPTVAVTRAMKDRGSGRVVLIGSTSGFLSEEGTAAYCASKAAVHSLVRSMAVDLARFGIQSNAVAPGWIHTELVDDFITNADPAALAGINPVGRVGQPDEVANVVEYLSLDAPDYLCGATIMVDGGQTGFAPLL